MRRARAGGACKTITRVRNTRIRLRAAKESVPVSKLWSTTKERTIEEKQKKHCNETKLTEMLIVVDSTPGIEEN
jgi:hypothetical protein